MTIAADSLIDAADLLQEHAPDGKHGNTKTLTCQYGTASAPTGTGNLYLKTDTGVPYVGDGSNALNIIGENGGDVSGQTRFGSVSGGNYKTLAVNTGFETYTGTARFVKSLRFHHGMLSDGPTPGAVTPIGDFMGYSMTIGDSHKVSFTIPEGIDTSIDPDVIVVWAINEAYATNSGEVRWSFDYSNVPTDETEAINSPTHTGTVNGSDQNIPATAYRLTKTTIGSLPNVAAGDFIGLHVSRIALVGGNNPTAEPILFEIRVEYTSNQHGTQAP